MTSRLGVVTGQGLADLIRERFGVRITFYLMLCLIVTNFGNAVAEFAGVASAMEIFGVSTPPGGPRRGAFSSGGSSSRAPTARSRRSS